MRGHGSLGAEILAGLDEASSEDLLPEPVHRDPCDERVVLVDQPAREAEAVHRQILAHRMEGRGGARVHAPGSGGEAPALPQLV